jgi:AraC-like DNA-binding protein
MAAVKRDRQAFIACLRASVTVATPRGEHKHKHRFDEFFICLNGDGTQHCEGRILEMKRGDVFCFPAREAHCCVAHEGKRAEGIVLYVTESVLDDAGIGDREILHVAQYINRIARAGENRLPLSKATGREFIKTGERMLSEDKAGRVGRMAALKMYWLTLMLAVLRDPNTPWKVQHQLESDRGDDRISRVIEFVNERYMLKIDVGEAARIAGLSRSQFHSVFKRTTGYTLLEKVAQARIRAASRMLRESDCEIIDVAFSCGFSSLSHFYHTFKDHMGLTPKELRQGVETG